MVLALKETLLPAGIEKQYMSNMSSKGRVLSETIPDHVNLGVRRKYVQRRTLTIWVAFATIGYVLSSNTFITLPSGARAVALTMMFPGAGYVGCANLLGGVLLLLTYMLLPVCLFAWFGAGGLLFPFLLWALSAVGAFFAAETDFFSYAGIVDASILVVFFGYFARFSANARVIGVKKRAVRNAALSDGLAAVSRAAVEPPPEEERELPLENLRELQWTIDQGLRAIDDWQNFTIIDQFQTAALRYQLYEMMYCLGAYQGIYAPNFHGYVNEAFRNLIEKSMTPKVLGFWKWETLWGKFKTDYEPVDKDNIMTTGFMLQGVALYTANTGDLRYTEPGSLRFNVTDKKCYPHDLHSLDRALVRQWGSDPYCLFSCEPNWIYSPCNLQGMTGQVVYDRVFGTNHAQALLPRFEESLITNFMESDGSIVPIRSQLTGFTIPGLCGALTDLINAFLCRGHLDHIARRMWAVFRQECIEIDQKTGELKLKNLVGADKIDPGLYKASEYALFPMLAYVAGEYGDEQIRKGARELAINGVGRYITETGAVALTKAKVSNSMNSSMVRSSLLRQGDWKRLISHGPSKTTLAGPILDRVPYPGVLVAKARSHASNDLELVLYPSAGSGVFELGIKGLTPGTKYTVDGAEITFKSDESGAGTFKVRVDDRTVITILPQSA